MGFHRYRGETAYGWRQCGSDILVAVDDAGPDGLLLRGIEQEQAFDVAIFPSGSGKVLPVDDVGGGPGGEAFGAAAAVECGLNGTSRAITGAEDKFTVAQRCVEIGFVSRGPGLSAHIGVIRRWGTWRNARGLWETSPDVN